MLYVKAVNSPSGSLQSGSSLSISFSHHTNMPCVLRPADLRRVLILNPPFLLDTPHMAFWRDPQTLTIFFLASNDEPLAIADIFVVFNGQKGRKNSNGLLGVIIFISIILENCDVDSLCEHGVCLAGGWSCSVTGSYGVHQNAPLHHSDTNTVRNHDTVLVSSTKEVKQSQSNDWYLLVVLTCFIIIVPVVIAIGCR